MNSPVTMIWSLWDLDLGEWHCPAGTTERSPAIHCRDKNDEITIRPVGTVETSMAAGRTEHLTERDPLKGDKDE